MITVHTKPLFLFLPYHGQISLQTRTKSRKSLNSILNFCNLQIAFKSQNKSSNAFRFKNCIHEELAPSAVYKFPYGLYNKSYYDECVRQLNVRVGEHTGILQLTKNKVNLKSSAVSDQLLLCNHSPSFDSFSLLTKENKKIYIRIEKISFSNER